ncbi:MAG: DNA-processing protein DprA [Bacteroidetes bacterium]|nr:DNA-processing protein DprA [Bacteroidota bacterium]
MIENRYKKKFSLYSIENPDFPYRLKQCEDSPLVFYFRGNADLNMRKTIAVVGTRSPTDYGKQQCLQFIRGLKDTGALIISGLAYGIDSIAHKTALQEGCQTLAVLAHGFHTVYPSENRNLAAKVINQGGLLTEFITGTKPDRENFPKRNRIVAGLSDAILVVESAERGGALITADIALSYNRDVFAIPGRVNDVQSGGCNWLIYDNKAAIARSSSDIINAMGWERVNPGGMQTELFSGLPPQQKRIYFLIKEYGSLKTDQLLIMSGLSNGELKSLLLEMELDGYLRVMPGNRYTTV